MYLRAFATDPDGDALRFNLISGQGEVVEIDTFPSGKSRHRRKEVILEVSDELGMKTKKDLDLKSKRQKRL